MAITIDWIAKIISVPKSTPEMTLIQSVPTVIYDLDLNAFHITLRDLEATTPGAPWATTHTHNGEVTLGGITYARIIEIIGGYTVTFEDDQYAVNLVGANSNVADVTNVNQVSIRPQNSAGLISSPAIEYASFGGGVTIDTSLSTTGTSYNIGTPANPAGNIADALLIASVRGLTKLFIIGDITLDVGDFRDFQIFGQSPDKSLITVNAIAQVQGAEFYECTIGGTLDGQSVLDHCHINTLAFVEGELRHCILHATITLGGSGDTQILNCWSGVPGSGAPVIDCGGSGRDLGVRQYSGGIKLINKTGADSVSLDFVSGHAILDSTVTGGTVVIRGANQITDNSVGATVIVPDAYHFDNVLMLLESQRGHHTATGNMFYWDPVNGDDGKDGLSRDTAKLTWGGASGVNSLVVAQNHDIVMLIPGETAGTTVITEQIVLNKEYTFLRGPGRDVHFLPTATTGVTVAISAEGCEFSGARVSTAPTGDGEAIEVSGADFAYIHDFWIEQCQGDGLRLLNVSYAKIKDAHIRNCLGNGLVFRGISQACEWNVLTDAFIAENIGNGVLFDGVNCQNNFVWGGEDGVTIMDNGGWGILEQASANFNHAVGPVLHVHENASGEVNFTGSESFAENIEQWLKATESSKLALIEQILRNKMVTDPDTGVLTLYDDAGSPLLTADIFEDVAGATSYSGGKIDRKERLT